MSNIEFDDVDEKHPIRTYIDLFKEKQDVDYESVTSIDQVIQMELLWE